jgi:hypothetical protein
VDRVASKAEQLVCQSLRSVSADKPDGSELEDSPGLRDLLGGLEYYVTELLMEHCAAWPRHEALDGILPTVCRKAGADGAEIAGACILISDQRETPIYISLRANPKDDEVQDLICCVGEVDSETGELARYPLGSSKAAWDVREGLDSIAWMHTIRLGTEVQATSRTTTTCDECTSLYFRETSTMAALCPECAHQLYGYERCEHNFRSERCIKCFWDGSISDLLDGRR